MRLLLERPPPELPVGLTAASLVAVELEDVLCVCGVVAVVPWVVDVIVRIFVLVPGFEGVTKVVPGATDVELVAVVGVDDVVG